LITHLYRNRLNMNQRSLFHLSFVFSLFVTVGLFAQGSAEQALFIYQEGSSTEIQVNHGNRVKLKLMSSGEVLMGPLMIEGPNKLSIKGVAFAASDILWLKKRPMSVIITGGVLQGLGAGTLLVGMSALSSIDRNSTNNAAAIVVIMLAAVASTALVVAGTVIKINRKFKVIKDWRFETRPRQIIYEN